MALKIVSIVRVEGDQPRELRIDDHVDADGKEVRGGASMIASLKRMVKREELHSVEVRPFEPSAEEAQKPTKRTAKAAPVGDDAA